MLTPSERQHQIPFGNDNKKSKDKNRDNSKSDNSARGVGTKITLSARLAVCVD